MDTPRLLTPSADDSPFHPVDATKKKGSSRPGRVGHRGLGSDCQYWRLKMIQPWNLSAIALMSVLAMPARAGTPLQAVVYLAELQSEQIYRISLDWDGAGTLTVSEPQFVGTAAAGGGLVASETLIYVTGAGQVSRIDLRNGQVATVQSFNNANTCSIDPTGENLYCGWRSALSRVPTSPFGNGTAVQLAGDDVEITGVAFTPTGDSFYSTGTEAFNGDFGSLDLDTGQTMRQQAGAFATGLAWDAYTQKILIAGLGRSRLVDPAAPAVIHSQRDDSASENYLSLSPDGLGHAIGTRCCIASPRLVLLDYSSTGNLADPQTVIVSVPIADLTFLSGQAIFAGDRIFHSAFEEGEP
ncbi:hypothetical protein [Dokdonella sp.]|uniref:hypothetical protein n=1 Tax=Dokdonella sp. TaxID=2291710 RepID=UPI0035284A2A